MGFCPVTELLGTDTDSYRKTGVVITSENNVIPIISIFSAFSEYQSISAPAADGNRVLVSVPRLSMISDNRNDDICNRV
jgi:hypothetical protein